ncbi:enoyl-CoA hydratase-related protein [Glycomyces algeriensis]|uniref:enoyl-CoA hydratase n=1 Tax=Glycomyces algeriensis TaxID=256037 RepID=A0A9W6G481_9ACTN|nr:enoyl-CoA hydratase-related protein [Glycomyces algeriensis]MDA1368031.1 enoyl-CoA hydratase-related protein [Glycomyces algeriensis]MDR7352540.1 enoyl-CoA hydratase [Glycomyces algeriensis]GLI40221.1 enoyl-CoA hydratase [Glycomyces algeriensis]
MRLKIERIGRVVRVRLHRPEVLNALDAELMTELVEALTPLDADPGVGCFVVTGSERAFAAGADITEMSGKSAADMLAEDYFAGWEAFAALRTPKLAAVAGYALGGGCELAMMCDMIIAADNARFGQPEITLGVIPGIGGTQRLTRLVGKAKAMDMILTGRLIDAFEAERIGLVSRVVPADRLAAEAGEVAEQIAGFGKLAVTAARDCVDRALETGLSDGIRYERRVFHALFATEDQKEGMLAFKEKRKAVFTGK